MTEDRFNRICSPESPARSYGFQRQGLPISGVHVNGVSPPGLDGGGTDRAVTREIQTVQTDRDQRYGRIR